MNCLEACLPAGDLILGKKVGDEGIPVFVTLGKVSSQYHRAITTHLKLKKFISVTIPSQLHNGICNLLPVGSSLSDKGN